MRGGGGRLGREMERVEEGGGRRAERRRGDETRRWQEMKQEWERMARKEEKSD